MNNNYYLWSWIGGSNYPLIRETRTPFQFLLVLDLLINWIMKYFIEKGQRFDYLTIIDEIYLTKKGYTQRYAKCICDCGKETVLRVTSLFVNKINSCGCKKNYYSKHRKCKTSLYYVFNCMKNRCYRKELPDYKNYGGRGITICNEWLDNFMSFYNWAINNGYRKGLTIERKDNNGNYTPVNCCFATRMEQCNNKRTNRIIKYKNEELTMMEFCRKYNLNYGLFESRIRANKTVRDSMINCGYYKFRSQKKLKVEPI